MSEDDVLFGYRLQLLDYAARTTVSEACRTFGVHRSTYYRWKRMVERHGLEVLRPRERRRPKMPNQLPAMVEERIVAYSIAHPGQGPRRISSELGREKWGGIVVSANGVWRCLRRHGLNTRHKRLSLVAGYRAPYEPPRDDVPELHIEVGRPGELVGFDCFYVGRLRGTEGAVWQLSAIDCYSSYAWSSSSCVRAAIPRRSRPRSSLVGSRATSNGRAGGSSACCATTATSFEARPSRPRSPRSGLASRTSARGGRRRTATSRLYTGSCSRNAGGQPSPATSTPATPGSGVSLSTTYGSTTSTAPPRTSHPWTHPCGHRLRCAQDGGEMSRKCRHILESVHTKRSMPAGRAIVSSSGRHRSASGSDALILVLL